MFGPMYSQMMKARLGVGKPMEGYGGFQPQATLPAPSPWLHQGGPRTTPYGPRPEGGAMGENPWNPRSTPFEDRPQGGVTPPPTPWGPQDGASLPAPSPWLHQKDNMGGATLPPPTPWEPSGGATLPQESPMKPSGRGYMGGMKNPWQRY